MREIVKNLLAVMLCAGAIVRLDLVPGDEPQHITFYNDPIECIQIDPTTLTWTQTGDITVLIVPDQTGLLLSVPLGTPTSTTAEINFTGSYP